MTDTHFLRITFAALVAANLALLASCDLQVRREARPVDHRSLERREFRLPHYHPEPRAKRPTEVEV